MDLRIALVTCAELPDLDPDDRELLAPLRERGAEVEAPVWDDPRVDWAGYDLTLLRSPWDYAPRRRDFVAWAEQVPRLANAAPVVAWNTDKAYLGELAEEGVATVPTTFVAPQGEWSGPPAGGDYVVKPTVSAGSKDTARYGPHDAERARAHVRGLQAAGRTAMVQPYVPSVDERGETALLFLGGDFSHAIRKGPLLLPGAEPTSGLFAPEEIEPRTPTEEERAVAERVLDAAPFPREELLYARVDLVEDEAGRPVLLELELTEPSLFLAHAPGAAERLAELAVAAARR